ncbi:ECF-type sigma factor [Lentisalinibacter orientalis]|uniref:ECF-type sigma factor n=1 Tax=Lentisalinibacter orientalis TaxID=2992241 RepID=UPI00386932DF
MAMASQITLLLESHRAGDADALNRLAAVLYPELKAMARRRTAGKPGLGATTLVQETFLKLLSGGELQPDDRRQFFALAATIMRQVIVDEVRYAMAGKRDGREVTLTESVMPVESQEKAQFLLEVDEMLGILESQDERLARVFECRYFAGLTTAETAEALAVSERSVERAWSSARSRIAELMEDTRE